MSTSCSPTVSTSYFGHVGRGRFLYSKVIKVEQVEHVWGARAGTLWGGMEPGLGPCTRTPCEQTDTLDWKHYLPVTSLASGYDGRRKRPQKISCFFLKVNLNKITILTNTSWVNKRSQVNIDAIKWYRNLSWNYCERMSISRLWLITFVRLKTTNDCHPNGNCKTSCY